ncbi:Protein FAM98A [Camelus dromedarius]|uniref:Protein FAM98A n=1 Tax=Camelus dromedarius TaxID=9838 RepID=A0A5N4D750_CAMDR|nr:Protein FAM98A [Camelus dromedarius]
MECDLMETDILESLEDLGYKGPLLEDGALSQAVSAGANSPEFTKLCAWLVSELRVLCKLEENVQATNSPSEAEEFQLEVSGLLGEMNCPYLSLTSGDVTKRLLIQKNCLLLLTYLISELEAARMLCVNTPPKKAQEGGGSEVFQELKGICIALGMSKPPANITMFQFFSGIEKKLKETLAKVPPNHVGKPLLKKPMGPAHWEKIEAINQAVANEYEVRRKLLIKRLDVTVQSFGWSDRAKSQTEKLAKVYQPKRSVLSPKSTISVAHLLAARQDLSKILRTSSGSIREKTACAINKRCHHGRKGKMAPSSKQEAEEEGEVVMNIPHMEDEEVMNKEEGEVDAVAMTMVAEGEEEEISIKEAGQMEGVEEEVATKMVVIEMRVSSQVAITVATVVAIKVVVIVVASKRLHILEVDTRVVDISRTIDTKMVGTTVIEAVVVEGEVVAEAEGVVQVREEVGEEEGARIITRGDSLNSTSSMGVISIIILDLDREDIILVEATEPYILLELK